ncbi:MAG: recombinase family protein [Flavisolibacter sp.]|nr:recombinase family protein [Flavisolibacter sp.]
MLFSKYDNDVRRQKVVSGMKEKLLQGYCVFPPPVGYSRSMQAGIPTPDSNAPFIKTAFKLKELGYSTEYILKQLRMQGCSISHKRLLEVFKNPFYCGYIYHSLLDDQYVKGKHQPLISVETFERVNACRVKYSKSETAEDSAPCPLTGFIICTKCNKKWTSYTVRKKGRDYYKRYYYKCNTIGCRCNRGAIEMHEQFAKLLSQFKVPAVLMEPFKEQLKITFNTMNRNQEVERSKLELKYAEVTEKANACAIRYATGEIGKDVYEIAKQQFTKQQSDLKTAINNLTSELSNLSDFVQFAVDLSQNLDWAWLSAKSNVKAKLQQVVFPGGIEYDAATCSYRTIKVNSLFNSFTCVSSRYNNKEKEQHKCCSQDSRLVAPTGIEPVSGV